MIGAFNAIEKVHPEEEHYYLEALGTRQDMQSKGVGTDGDRHVAQSALTRRAVRQIETWAGGLPTNSMTSDTEGSRQPSEGDGLVGPDGPVGCLVEG
jgi:hypothetical protein